MKITEKWLSETKLRLEYVDNYITHTLPDDENRDYLSYLIYEEINKVNTLLASFKSD